MPFLPLFAAIFSGSVAGDHISPISDTTIMTATSTHMDHQEHVDTQVGYALPVVFLSACSFYVTGVFSLSTDPSNIVIPTILISFVVLSIYTVVRSKKFSNLTNSDK